MARDNKVPGTETEGPVASTEQLPQPSDSALKTLAELYKELKPERFHHECAAALHGWKAHLHHAGEQLQLTRDDYQAAIAAALKGSGDIPHAPALSPFFGKGI